MAEIIQIGAAVFVVLVVVFAVYAHTQGLDLAALLEPRAPAPGLAAKVQADSERAVAVARAAIPEPGAPPVSPAASVQDPATKGDDMSNPLQAVEDIGKRALAVVEGFDAFIAGKVKEAVDALTAEYDAKVGVLESTIESLEVKLGLRVAPASNEPAENGDTPEKEVG